ncbi:MAG: DUF4263 domain-containing protein [Candidatus Marinimicrobia bacterium]|nr:DUF4263 domain-containing protein [Candidatus Neomarinimicrobiota bacterium]
MTQILIETALEKLKQLLESSINEESEYQKYFEANPIVFKLLGFKEAHPQLNLHSKNGEHLIPDFVLKHENGLYEICDVKLPSEKIVKKKRYRDEFYAKISSEYAGQLRNYASYFSDSLNREYIEKEYGLKINPNPRKIMIIGRNESLDRFVVHEILNSRGYEFTLITYDDIIEHLTYCLQTSFVSERQFFGTSFLIIMRIQDLAKEHDQFVIDFGDDDQKSRFSIFLDGNNNLCFRVIDSTGNDWSIKAFKNRDLFKFDEYFYLHCSVGCSPEYSIMEMYINGSRLEKREFNHSLFDGRGVHYKNRIFASDINKSNGSCLSFELIKCYNHNLNLNDRLREDSEFLRRLIWTASQHKLCTMFFGEGAFTEIKYDYGQKSPVNPGLEAHWDIHNLFDKGKSILEMRRELNQIFDDV